MWMWILGLVLFVSLGVAVFLGKVCSLTSRENDLEEVPQEIADFLVALFAEFAQRPQRCQVQGTLEGPFHLILSVQGQEVPVNVEQLYFAYQADKTRLGESVEQLLAEIEGSALEQPTDHPFAAVATRILPQVRSQEWVRKNSPALGEGALVQRGLGADLSVCYVIDDPWAVVFLCNAHLKQWGMDAEALHQLAVQNLRSQSGDVPLPEEGEQGVLLNSGDGYDAARVLLLDPDRVQGLLIAMPDQDQLWIGRDPQESGGVGLESLMRTSQTQHDNATHPVAGGLYRLSNHKLEPVDS